MTTLPPELIGEIMYQLFNRDALKACALTASSLRDPSQRILLRSLFLDWHSSRASEFLALLVESPHIAVYITRITLSVSIIRDDGAPVEIPGLGGVLARLGNVRHCMITGADHPVTQRWDSSAPVAALITEFIQRQPLEEIRIFFLEPIPLSVLAVFLSVAPTAFFYCSFPFVDDEQTFPTRTTPMRPILRRLLLSGSSDSICDVLCRPQFAPYMSAVRALELCTHRAENLRILSAVCCTLEQLLIGSTAFLRSRSIVFPQLPALRAIDFTMPARDYDPVWVETFFPAILSAVTPALEEIRITCHLFSGPLPQQMNMPAADMLQDIDRLVAADASSPRLCWIVRLKADDRDLIAEFVASVQRGMPRMHGLGKLVVRRSQ